MNILIAPDSFKNCLRAGEVASAIRQGICSVQPQWTVDLLPMADGGEGTVEAFLAIGNSQEKRYAVSGPHGKQVEASAAFLPDDTCVVEIASAAGLELISPAERNPMQTTTFGVGQLLRKCAEDGARKIIVGLGGSATVDGGIGMIQALGYRLYEKNGTLIQNGASGKDLKKIASVDDSQVPEPVRRLKIISACDVTTRLSRCAQVYGPQKGATPDMVQELAEGLASFASVLQDAGEVDGDGAAGGLGYAFRHFLGATVRSGAELLLEQAGFDNLCEKADWVITGEGRTDFQSAEGKLCGCVARHAKASGCGVILASGALERHFQPPQNLFDAVFSVAPGPVPLTEALEDARENLIRFGRNLAALLRPRH